MMMGVLAACGRWGFDDASGRSSVDGPGASDAISDADLTGLLPFGTPVAIASVNSASDDGSFRLAANELTGWFWSGRSGNNQLYEATRPNLATAWSVVLLANVNTASAELDPTTTPDELTLVFRSNRAGGTGGNDLYQATRTTTANPFSVATQIANLNTASSDVQPFLRADGAELFFTSNRNGTYDIFRSVRTGNAFGAPTLVSELSTATDNEQDPALSPDGLTIYWRSDRPGGLGASDIYTATRASLTDAFGPATHVANVSSSSDDGVSWVSADGARLYISSNRGGATNHIYVSTRGG